MRRKTRSQRLKEYRKQRYQRLINVIEGRFSRSAKMSKGNKIVLFVIVAVFLFMNIFSLKYKNTTFDFSVDDFKSKYEFFLLENQDLFEYDKNLKDIIKNKNEYSFFQESSNKTSNLIAVDQYTDKVRRIGVIGRPKDDDIFKKSYIENVIFVLSLVLDEKHISYKYLKDIGVLNENDELIYHKNKFRKRQDNMIISFSYTQDSLIFTLENE